MSIYRAAMTKLTKSLQQQQQQQAVNNNKNGCSKVVVDFDRDPLYKSFKSQFNAVLAYLMKRKTAADFKMKLNEQLVKLWSNFEDRLPRDFIEEKILSMASHLVNNQEYEAVIWHCYDKLLMRYYPKSFTFINFVTVEHLLCLVDCRDFNSLPVENALQSIIGRIMSKYKLLMSSDASLTNVCSVPSCLHMLKQLHVILDAIFLYDDLYWLVYNGHMVLNAALIAKSLPTPVCIRVYNTKYQVLLHVKRCTECMDASGELSSVDYLQWRVTLCIAVCQCYYEIGEEERAEACARQMLLKMNDLKEDLLKNSKPANVKVDDERCGGCIGSCDAAAVADTTAAATANTSTTMKMMKERRESELGGKIGIGGCHGNEKKGDLSVMVFKRAVIETRRRPRDFLRPVNRFNIKQFANLQWPRTNTEKMLDLMFIGTSAKFLAILNALTNCGRRSLRGRILLTSPVNQYDLGGSSSANNNNNNNQNIAVDLEVQDVYEELFFAGQELIAGIGGNKNTDDVANSMITLTMTTMMKGVVVDDDSKDNDGVGGDIKTLNNPAYEKQRLELEILKMVDKVTMKKGLRGTIEKEDRLYIGRRRMNIELT
ncbi:hypothetical protein HELRODRAFT_171986 [Helobdella robusta]|uniref:Uncharacterized protein n=1 Tax=Helobdella robusta TaxID=6412 RepID=T1F4X2_HELRO|nr:hypothetical protein HELRODRAFT_171986 [Helobdella robusta]ESO04979.1 hypothetical protein HELRODRAFT_171986 [Helobdella robusta]